MSKTMDQKRAAHAWEVARRDRDDEEFEAMVKKLPVLIQTCGLGQAVAFLEAKRKAPKLAEALNDWLSQAIPGGGGKLLDRIVHGDGDFLRRATGESLAYLFWLGRFAEANKRNGK